MTILESPEQLIGSILGKYKLLSYCGYGAMARVYKAQHVTLERLGAVKILHPHYASDTELIDQFISEARNLAILRHPNIVQVYDMESQDQYSFIVMEFIEGPTLRDVIIEAREKNERLPISYSLRMVYSLAAALSYAHQRNVIHRDVKPGNVMIENVGGRVVLADFGLARLLTKKQMTNPGTIKGTPAYMSPEQAMGRPSHLQSDIYSLGVIFYELLTGRLPFDDENPFTIAMKHVNDPLVPPRELVPEIPDQVEKIVVRSMAKDPADRYSTANEFIEDLTKVRLQVKTARLPSARLSDLALRSDKESTWSVPAVEGESGAQVCLHFLDTGQILNLEMGREYTIGRKHKTQSIVPDIDLTPYSDYEWGISRLHASLSVFQDNVTITDIGSSNGTYHAGNKIPQNTPFQVKHGDVFLLGKLKVQILIYS